MRKKKIGYEAGSGNVFADLGLPNAEEHLIKAQFVYKIDTLMKERRLKQVEAAAVPGGARAGRRDRYQATSGSSARRPASRRCTIASRAVPAEIRR
jgi:hypothetical protein